MPDVFLIGAAKAATTSLAEVLGADPRFHVNRGDGSGYEIAYHAGPNRDRSAAWYLDHFAGASPDQVTVDYSTAYSRFPEWDAAPAMAALAPGARVLYQLREPIERMRSHWRMRVREGTESRSFSEAVRSVPVYVDASSYGMQLTRYLELFPPEAMMVTTVEMAVEDVGSIVEQVLRHVGRSVDDVEGAADTPLPRRNPGAAVQPPPLVRRLLRSRLGRSVRAAVPASVRSALGKQLQQPITYPDSELPPHQTIELQARFAADLEAVRPFLPQTWDGWGLLTREP